MARLWNTADGLLDTASAVIRPYGAQGETTVLPWRLVERDHRTRVLFSHGTPSAQNRMRRSVTWKRAAAPGPSGLD